MLKTIRQTIKRFNMLAPQDGVVVGLSGGADSVVLLAALAALSAELGISVYAAHINHNLRSEAMCDEGFARRFCDERGIPFFVFNADVKGAASREKLSIEESGRKLRYQYLHQAMEHFGAKKIAVGHHSDDNAETILLNLFRGAGLRGLCGIPPVNGKIIRPLLEIKRNDIETYARENNLNFVTDETNAESDYSRNYVRNKIIPVIQEHFDDSVAATMAKNALAMRADEDFLDTTARQIFENMCRQFGAPARDAHTLPCQPSSEITLSIPVLLSHPTALITRIIRQAIATLRGPEALKDIKSIHIQSILDIAQGRTGREANLPDFTVKREYENLVLFKNIQSFVDYNSYALTPDIPIKILSTQIILTFKSPPINQFYCTHAFNYDNVDTILEVRTRRPGDRITLSGGTKKLQDFFTDTKTPKSQRDQILLLADGSNIIWIMDRHNRTNTAYKPIQGKRTCWVMICPGFDIKV